MRESRESARLSLREKNKSYLRRYYELGTLDMNFQTSPALPIAMFGSPIPTYPMMVVPS
jgi:hypothetical protein